jgi:hypothetical protein
MEFVLSIIYNPDLNYDTEISNSTFLTPTVFFFLEID